MSLPPEYVKLWQAARLYNPKLISQQKSIISTREVACMIIPAIQLPFCVAFFIHFPLVYQRLISFQKPSIAILSKTISDKFSIAALHTSFLQYNHCVIKNNTLEEFE